MNPIKYLLIENNDEKKSRIKLDKKNSPFAVLQNLTIN